MTAASATLLRPSSPIRQGQKKNGSELKKGAVTKRGATSKRGRGGRGPKSAPKSADQLDAEMDAYMKDQVSLVMKK